MVFSIGTKVRLKHTGDIGKITAILDLGMLEVQLLDDDMTIPIFEDDLERFEENQSKATAKVVQGKQKKEAVPPPTPKIETQYTILKSEGIQLAFDPVEKADGTVDFYHIILLNDTTFDTIFTFTLSLLDASLRKVNGKLSAVSVENVGKLTYDELNDAPIVNVEIWQVTTVGTGNKLSAEIKIKPKQFFKKKRTAPFLNRPAHLYSLFTDFDPPEKESGEDLETYTKKNIRPISKKRKQSYQYSSIPDTEELAQFVPEIDLHLENLMSRSQNKMSNAEKIRIQLSHFDNFIEKAIRLGVDRVFIIHGVGKGRLRDAIASRLIQFPEVKTFKNEFHPRYGYGATEVIFK